MVGDPRRRALKVSAVTAVANSREARFDAGACHGRHSCTLHANAGLAEDEIASLIQSGAAHASLEGVNLAAMALTILKSHSESR